MEGLRSTRRPPHSCRSKACIGIIRLTKDMKSGMVYRSKCFSFLSWIQCFLAIILMAIHVVLYGENFLKTPTTTTDSEDFLSTELGGGILVSGIQILAAATTLLAVDESNYCWLHTAMSFHIMSVFGNFLLCLHMFTVIFPGFSLKMLMTIPNWDISKEHTTTEDYNNLRHIMMAIVTVLSIISVFLGSFLGSATGYGVFCGTDTSGKRKSSSVVDRIKDLRQSKLVKFNKSSFEPTNVAANLSAEQFTSFENYMQAKEDSVIYINRHAQLRKSNSSDA